MEKMSSSVTDRLYLSNRQEIVTLLSFRNTEGQEEKHGKLALLFSGTNCHPQGGGQPSDIGSVIKVADGQADERIFEINFAQSQGSEVWHFGDAVNGKEHLIESGIQARVEIDASRRALNTRLHSAGHLIDSAMSRLGAPWDLLKPHKGYHFPDGPNVEFIIPAEVSVAENEIKALQALLNDCLKNLIENNIPTKISFDESGLRIVNISGNECPCGGTHVESPSELISVTVNKVKRKKENLKISYVVE